ncbi:MAG: glycosyl hydrolase family 17 protein [Kiritimatiellae bacterium]|nr:glycosyl hydrolase family 17 protein [Kiritimatiellia bacterium]
MSAIRPGRMWVAVAVLEVFVRMPVATAGPPRPLDGAAYGPFRAGQAPGGAYPTTNQIAADLQTLQRLCAVIRTYGVEQTLAEIPRLCAAAGLDCWPGAWLDTSPVANTQQVQRLIAIGQAGHATTKGLIVGNEVRLFNRLPLSTLTDFVQQVRVATGLPVATAEPWQIWTGAEGSNLAAAVDVILVHVHPYWDGVPATGAAAYVARRWSEVTNLHPHKPVWIGETGWPTAGPANGAAVPGIAEQRTFLHSFAVLARERGIRWFVFEAFDEPWKTEGGVGPHWGLMTVERALKPPLVEWLSAATPLTAVQREAGGVRLRWRSFPGNPYWVQRSTTPPAAWANVTNISGAVGEETSAVVSAGGTPAWWFRVSALY